MSQPTPGQGWSELLRALPALILTDANIDELVAVVVKHGGSGDRDRNDRPPPPVRLAVGTEGRDERVPHDVAYQLIRTSRWPALASLGT